MTRLLSAPGIAAAPRPLGIPDPSLDAASRALVERATAEAYERGRRDGAAAAAAAVDGAVARVLSALQRSGTDLRGIAAEADVALAAQIATAVLGREPGDDAAALLTRVEAALGALDDECVTVHLHAEDAAVLAEPLDRVARSAGSVIEVVVDPTLPAGEAILAGRWARADLSRLGAWAAVEACLAGEPDDA